jgi:FtsP/CotA-like multicopper oxidase with cupredoxin domain
MMNAKHEHEVVSVVALDGRDETAILALAATLASGLDAPLAAAIVRSARERDIPFTSVDAHEARVGVGLAASVAGHAVVLGNATMFTDLGLSIDRLGNWSERLRQHGQHVLFVAVDGRTAGFLGVIDPQTEDNMNSHFKENTMQQSTSTADLFPTDAANLPNAQPTDVVELSHGDEFDLRIGQVSKRLGDATVRMLAYNGSIPGPTLRVKQGTEIVINVANDGDLETTVHWHGLRLDNRYDGTAATQRPIPVGGTFKYRLSFPDPGVYWYHPHIREDYGQEMGLYGNILVAPSAADYWPPANREVTLMLDDLRLEDGKVAPFNRTHPTYTAMGRFGNVLLINGQPQVTLRATQGEVVRFYLTNAANARVFNMSLPGARMKLVGGDSGRYERETFVDDVLIAPSERAVVDVMFEHTGGLALQHRTPERTYALATITVGLEPAVPSLASEFGDLRTNSEIAVARESITHYLTAEPDKTLALIAEMDMGEAEAPTGSKASYVCPMHPEVTSTEPGRCPKCRMKLVPSQLVHMHADATTNHVAATAERTHQQLAGIEWEDDMLEINRMTNPANMRWKLVEPSTGDEGEAIAWQFRVGDRVKIRLINEMDSDHPMQHPFHIHGAGRFLILSRDGVVEPNLVWKDTVLVPTGQTVDILLDVTHAGVWMAHCHIAEHHESGMMLTFHVYQ